MHQLARPVRILRVPLAVAAALFLLVSPALAQQEPQDPQQAAQAAQEATPEIQEQAQALLDSVALARVRIAGLTERLETAEGEEARLLERRLVRERMEAFENIQTLALLIVEEEKTGAEASALRAPVVPLMREIEAAVQRIAEHARNATRDLARQLSDASSSERPILERRLDNAQIRMDELYTAYMRHIENMEALGLDAVSERDDLAERLIERAENLSVRIELAAEQKKDFEARLKDVPGDADLLAELRAARDKLAGSIRSLTAATTLMEQLELDTAKYSEILIAATGSLTTDVLDTSVVVRLFRKWMAGILNWIATSGPGFLFKMLLLLAILVVARLVSKLVREIARKAISSSRLNFTRLLQEMIVSAVGNLVMLLGLLVGLSQLGITLGPLLAGLGIAGFVIGFALQDTLSNFAAGMMILIYRPYDVGDLVEAVGAFGTVHNMSLVSTTILTIDHQTLIIPNAKIWGDVIKNVTAQSTRRVDLEFGIGYADDIKKAERVLKSIVEAHHLVLEDPAPLVKVHELGDSSVNFVVRPWVKTDDYWEVYWDITREVKLRFDSEGISIPFPQRDVHLYPEQAARPPADLDETSAAG